MKYNFSEILGKVTVDSKDDGYGFIVRTRLETVRELMEGGGYFLLAEGNLCNVYAKKGARLNDGMLMVSSHIDSVYSSCFCEDAGECYRGTFDNSLTNAAVVLCAIEGMFPDNVLVCFGGDEEKDSRGCAEAVGLLRDMGADIRMVVVTDVTNVGWDDENAFTLENHIGIDMVTGYRIISSLAALPFGFTSAPSAEPDETWELCKLDIPCFSLCAPVSGDMHSDKGTYARKAQMDIYCRALAAIIEVC